MSQLAVSQEQWFQCFHGLGWNSPLPEQTWQQLGGGPGQYLDWPTVYGLINGIGWSDEHAKTLWLQLQALLDPPEPQPVPVTQQPMQAAHNSWEQTVRPSAQSFDPYSQDLRSPAGWLPRVGAALLDLGVLIVPFAVITMVIAGASASSITSSSGFGFASLLAAILCLSIFTAYARFLNSRSGEHQGQTLGKQVTKVRVVREDGRPLDTRTILMREGLGKCVVFYLLLFLLPSTLLGGFGMVIEIISLFGWWVVCPLVDKQNRCPHDMIAHTLPTQG